MNALMQLFAALGLLIAIAVPSSAAAADESRWSKSVAFYLWLADTDLDAKIDGESVGGGTIKFKDLVDKTEFGYAILAEAGPSNGQWSLFTDVGYFDLEDRISFGEAKVDADVDAVVLDLAGVYSPTSFGGNFGVYAGVRYLSIDTKIKIAVTGGDPVKFSDDVSYTDGLLGLRYRTDLSDKWSLKFRGDVSTGDTEYSFQIEGLIGYRFGKTDDKQLLFGYRYRKTKIEEGPLTQEIVTAGPIAALRFDF